VDDGMSEQDVHNWPSADVIVSYDPEKEQIRYTTLSTEKVLHIQDLKAQQQRVVYPFWRIVKNKLVQLKN
jgi:hypothetical protein